MSVCEFALNGEEAIKIAISVVEKAIQLVESKLYRLRPIALMLLDLQMPIKNGIVVL